MNSVTEGTSALIGPRPLQNRAFQGRGTFYDIGQGACGRIDYEPAYIVAMNAEQYGTGYPGAECFKGITIQGGPNNGYAQAIVADLCPGCPWGGLDMSRALFQNFAPLDAGTVSVFWWYNDQPTSTSSESIWIASSTAEPSTTQWTPPSPMDISSTVTWISAYTTGSWPSGTSSTVTWSNSAFSYDTATSSSPTPTSSWSQPLSTTDSSVTSTCSSWSQPSSSSYTQAESSATVSTSDDYWKSATEISIDHSTTASTQAISTTPTSAASKVAQASSSVQPVPQRQRYNIVDGNLNILLTLIVQVGNLVVDINLQG